MTRGNINPFTSVLVGQSATVTVVFEIPADRLKGARFVVGVHYNNGVTPISARPTFDLPEPLPQSSKPIEIAATQTQAAR